MKKNMKWIKFVFDFVESFADVFDRAFEFCFLFLGEVG